MLAFDAVDVSLDCGRVLEQISIEFGAGKIHALVGENGAGKSTLLKTAAGLLQPSNGRVKIGECVRSGWNARAASTAGLRMVFQHTALVGSMTAVENIELARTTGHFVRFDEALERLRALASKLGLMVPLDVPVERLGVAEKQRVELLRAMSEDCCVLVLDEPTAVLPPQEIETLYGTLRRIADSGICVVVVTHKLSEVAQYADTVAAIRRGKIAGQREVEPRGPMDDVLRWVMGETPVLESEIARTPAGKRRVLHAENVHFKSLHGASFDVREGEIVGLAGIDGNGQEALTLLLGDKKEPEHGRLQFDHAVVVREDRQHDGLVLDANVLDNSLLGMHTRLSLAGVLRSAKLSERAAEVLASVAATLSPQLRGIEGGDKQMLFRDVRSLSGGNQQKIIIARGLDKALKREGGQASCILLLHFPTRGVDVGAAQLIHEQIRQSVKESGVGVLLRSADLDELRALCDRILVLRKGAVVAEFSSSATDAEIGRAMLAGDTLP